MKNLSLVLNLVLAVAVVVLFYLHFSGGSETSAKSSNPEQSAITGDLRIAFISVDSVLKYYEFFKISRDKLEAKGKKMDTDFKNRAQGLQREITSYQNTVSNLTIGQAKAIEEDLTKKQQNLRMYQESLAQELAVEENKLTQDLYDKITAYLKKYGNENGIHAVFKFDPSSDLLYAGEVMDITKDVVAGLNDEYKATASQPADSTKTKK
ncbi:MAG TPA: OmpH family outer membrane protein [Cyclobacteriaceae bacterium]|nr:OmpH family outer membrane protein [Cyclobacteriaceae bacterium]HRW98434.1 OmpH family outer membrane protein [Cyclobacteriaceae bacterium]